MPSHIGLIAVLTVVSLAPFVLAVGSCFLKFSIVLVLVRNAIGLQNVPSNLALNGIALLLSVFVMMPVARGVQSYLDAHPLDLTDRRQVERFADEGLSGYKAFLYRHSKRSLVDYFDGLQRASEQDAARTDPDQANVSPAPATESPTDESSEADAARISADGDADTLSLASLLPAYALSEIEDAFRIGFYLYLPFVVIDLVVSNVLLALGMMMMSPVTISIPIKLLLFVAMDGWSMLSRGLVGQYLGVTAHGP